MTEVDKYIFADDYVNPRGIPKVDFVENVADFVRASGSNAETLLKRFSEQYSKYKLAEHRLTRSVSSLEGKIPDIKKTVSTLEFMKSSLQSTEGNESSGFRTHYGLTEQIFCEAIVKPQETVHLWLGANVMVEYTFDEALALLTKNLSSAQVNLEKTKEDLSWLQEQQTILEVNTSRLYNYDVMERRNKKPTDTSSSNSNNAQEEKDKKSIANESS